MTYLIIKALHIIFMVSYFAGIFYLVEFLCITKTLMLFNGQDLLEITIYKGTKNNGANSLFGLKVGDKVYIQFE